MRVFGCQTHARNESERRWEPSRAHHRPIRKFTDGFEYEHSCWDPKGTFKFSFCPFVLVQLIGDPTGTSRGLIRLPIPGPVLDAEFDELPGVSNQLLTLLVSRNFL